MKVVASFQDCYKWEQGYLTADLNFTTLCLYFSFLAYSYFLTRSVTTTNPSYANSKNVVLVKHFVGDL